MACAFVLEGSPSSLMSLKLERRPSEPLVWPFALLWGNLTPLLDLPMAADAWMLCWRHWSYADMSTVAVEIEPGLETTTFVWRWAFGDATWPRREQLRGGGIRSVAAAAVWLGRCVRTFFLGRKSIRQFLVRRWPERSIQGRTEKNERGATLRVSRCRDKSKESAEARRRGSKNLRDQQMRLLL